MSNRTAVPIETESQPAVPQTGSTESVAAARMGKRSRSWRIWLLLGVLAVLATVFVRWGIADHYLLSAEQAIQYRRLAEAEERLRQAERWRADPARVAFLQLRTARLAEDGPRMREMLDRAKRRGTDPALIDLESWLIKAQSGAIEQLTADMSAMLAAYPDELHEIAEAWLSGLTLRQSWTAAAQSVAVWLTLDPNDPRAHLWQGRVARMREQRKRALEAFEQAVKLDPQMSEGRLEYAEELRFFNRWDESAAQYRRVLQADPEEYRAILGLAHANNSVGNYDEAIPLLENLLKRMPSNYFARLLLGESFQAKEQPEKILEIVLPGLETWPLDKGYHYLLAQAYADLGKDACSEFHFQMVNEADEQVAQIDKLLELVKTRPDDAELRYDLGYLYMQYLWREEGAMWLQACLALDPHHARACRELATFFDSVGRPELARSHRKDAAAPDTKAKELLARKPQC